MCNLRVHFRGVIFLYASLFLNICFKKKREKVQNVSVRSFEVQCEDKTNKHE